MASCGEDALDSWAWRVAACFGVIPAGVVTAEDEGGWSAVTIAIWAGVAPIDLANCST